ncbi:MAG TPA: alpha/beta hydrolase [Gammaproteobacteria bacterium]|nr:alpha/beta hydrolase [Gammaproteobacteria bacterium]
MTRRAVSSTAVEIEGPAGRIEGALDATGEAPSAVAVVCHPHPLQQGTMQNKVTTTLARAFANLGAVSVRFNFRGVGASEGRHADGVGERDDVLSVVAWSRSRWPGLRVYLAGFSFGAAMALGVAAHAAPAGLVTVAPPINRLPADFAPPRCPWLLVHGSADDVVPAEPVLAWARALAAPPRVVLLDGVGHFFHGNLNALGDAVTGFFGADFAPGV